MATTLEGVSVSSFARKSRFCYGGGFCVSWLAFSVDLDYVYFACCAGLAVLHSMAVVESCGGHDLQHAATPLAVVSDGRSVAS